MGTRKGGREGWGEKAKGDSMEDEMFRTIRLIGWMSASGLKDTAGVRVVLGGGCCVWRRQ